MPEGEVMDPEEVGTGGRADYRDLPEWLDLVHDYVWDGDGE